MLYNYLDKAGSDVIGMAKHIPADALLQLRQRLDHLRAKVRSGRHRCWPLAVAKLYGLSTSSAQRLANLSVT